MGVAVVFPGQGTQDPGMGLPWRDDPAWSVVDRAEAALGEPLAHLITDAPDDVLARTRNAQLAVLLTSLVAWEAMQPLAERASRVRRPLARTGHGTDRRGQPPLRRRRALRGPARRAHAGRSRRASRAAWPRCSAPRSNRPKARARRPPTACWVANDNAPGQVVIAGTPEGLEAASARAKELGVKRVTPLNVGGAFHTPLMHDASVGLAGELTAVTFAAPAAPVVSNGDAVAYADADGWRERLAEHVSVPVRWRSTMDTLVAAGAGTFLEVGHGSMLAALAEARRTPTSTVQNISIPEDIPTKLEVG